MMVSEKLILSLLHKDGAFPLKAILQSSGICKVVAEGPKAAELTAAGLPVVGFVCHPLTWYLSLWRRGCQGKGALFSRLTDDARWARLSERVSTRRMSSAEGGRKGTRYQMPDGWSADHARTVWYGDPMSVPAFREWLTAVLGTPALRRLVALSPKQAKAEQWAGLMTREYIDTYISDLDDEADLPDSVDAMTDLDAKYGVARHFIRVESLSADALAVLQALGVELDSEQRRGFVKLGSRDTPPNEGDFFDAKGLALVGRREKFILQKFGYELGAQSRRSKRVEAGGSAPGRLERMSSRASKQALKGDIDALLEVAQKVEVKAARKASGEQPSKEERASLKLAREQRQAQRVAQRPPKSDRTAKGKGTAAAATVKPDPEDLID